MWHQNLSVALLSRAQELPFMIFRPPRAHRGHRPAQRDALSHCSYLDQTFWSTHPPTNKAMYGGRHAA